MKSPLALTALFVSIFSIHASAAADFTGAWKLEFNPDFSGHPATLYCAFQQHGQKLTIDCDGQKMSGEVKGRNVKFQHKTGKQNEVTAVYTGTLDEKGTTLKGAWHLSPDNREGKFEARRQDPK